MMNLPENFILFDTEYTAWEGSSQRKWSGPNEYRELVQIGAILVREKDLTEIGNFSVFVKPKFNPKLSEYFINLTGITQKELDEKGIDFESAIIEFKKWCGNFPAYSYGRDESILKENCGFYGKSFSFPDSQFYDVRDIFRENGIDTSKYFSGAITEAFGVKASRRDHDALNDSRIILDGLIELRKKLNA